MPEQVTSPPSAPAVAGTEPYRAALDEIVARLQPERALVMQREQGSWRMLAAFGFESGEGRIIDLPVSLFLLQDVLDSAEPALIGDLQKHAAYGHRHSVFLSGIRSLVCVPLWLGPEPIPTGLVYLDSRLESYFTFRNQTDLLRLARKLEDRLREPREPVPAPEKARITVRVEVPVTPTLPFLAQWRERLQSLLELTRGDPKAPWKHWTCSSTALSVFLRSLAIMMKAGLPIDQGLDHLARAGSQEDPRMVRIACLILERLLSGFTLTRAFSQCPRAIPRVILVMLAVAEKSGRLPEMLESAAAYAEKLHELRQRLRAALLYPACVLGGSLLFLLVLLPYLFRQQLGLVQSLGGKLPLVTRWLVSLFLSLTKPLVLAGLLIAGGLLAGMSAWRLRRPAALLRLYTRALRLPLVGRLLRLSAARRFAQAYAVMTEMGVPLQDALPLAAASSGSPLMEDRLDEVIRAVTERGAMLSRAIQGFEQLPPSFGHMLAAAEESGALVRTLGNLERLYAWEFEAHLDTCLALLEPAIMLGLGVLVGLIMMLTLMPMMQLLQAL